LELIDAIGEPNIVGPLDTYHMNTEEPDLVSHLGMWW
jgi:hydroxypyruvate isomerase